MVEGQERAPAPAGPQVGLPATGAGATRHRHRWVAAIGVVVAVIVVVRGSGGSAGWEYQTSETPSRLVTDGDTVCGTDRAPWDGTVIDAEVVPSPQADGRAFCLDVASGDERGNWPVGGNAVVTGVEGDVVLVFDGDSRTTTGFALDGTERWSVPNDDPFYQDAAVADEVLAIRGETPPPGTRGYDLLGVDMATGQERWRVATGTQENTVEVGVTSRILTDGAHFYYVDVAVTPGSGAGGAATVDDLSASVVALDPGTGTELWRYKLVAGDEGNPLNVMVEEAVPAAGGATVALAVNHQGRELELVVLDTATGDLAWDVELNHVPGVPPLAGVVAHLDGVTVAHDGSRLRAFDDAGDELWAVDAPDQTDMRSGQLREHEGVLYLGGRELHEVDPRTGRSQLVADQVGDTWLLTDHQLVTTGLGVTGLLGQPLP